MSKAIRGILLFGICCAPSAHAGIILHLEFENNANNSGSLAAANNGTVFGKASYSTDAIRGNYSIDMGSMLGDHGYVKVPSFVLGNTATIATWVKADFNGPVGILSRDGMNTVFSTRLNTYSPSGALFFVNQWNTQNRALRFESGVGGSYTGMGTPANSVDNNTWQHLALTINRTTDTVEFYVDGTKLPSTNSFYETFPDNRAMYIGAPGTVDWWHFDGKIDDFRVYDTVLSASEILDLVSSSPPVPEPSSLVIWSLIGLAFVGSGWYRRRKTG